MSQFYDEDLLLNVTREDFEECNADLINKIINHMERICKMGHVPKTEIDSIFMIGGSSNIPKLEEMLKEEFSRASLKNEIDPRTVVVEGVGIYVKEWLDCGMICTENVTTKDIYMLSDDKLVKLIPEGTKVPFEIDIPVFVDNKELFIELFEQQIGSNGETTPIKIGTYTIRNLQKQMTVQQFQIYIDEDGLLSVEFETDDGQILPCEKEEEKVFIAIYVDPEILKSQDFIKQLF